MIEASILTYLVNLAHPKTPNFLCNRIYALMLNTKQLALIAFFISALICGCKPSGPKIEMDSAFEILDNEAYKLFSSTAQMEVLDSGFTWTEGPLWMNKTQQLLFNDIPANKTFSWAKKEGTKVYLAPSGFTIGVSHEGELGANDWLLNPDEKLTLCQHSPAMSLLHPTTQS